jgi:tetratricopeptide (TPR) repeat protein
MIKQPFIILLFKFFFIAALFFLGSRAVLLNIEAIETEGTFSFLSQNNQGFAGLLIKASQDKILTQPQEAISLLQKAIQKDPVDSRIYLLMGLAYERLGDVARAKTLMRDAHQLGPRKPLNQIEIGQFWFRQNEIDEALLHWTTALEMKHELREKGFKDLILFMEKPLYLEAMRRVILKHNPLWWAEFFNQAAFSIKNIDQLKGLYEARLSSGANISASEHNAMFERLMRDHQWSDAYFTWVNRLPQSQLKFLGNIFDGGFNLNPSNEGFGWRTNQDQAYHFYMNSGTDKKTPHALEILFSGSQPKNNVLIHQLLLLEPGTFNLKGEVNSEELKAGEGLIWHLNCLNGTHIGVTTLFQGNMGWTTFNQELTIPHGAECKVQDLSLRISADINQPFIYKGLVRFKNLAIIPILKN